MADIRFVAVIDIGKTNAKLALVDLSSLREIAVKKTPNAVRTDGPYPHHDVERLWGFILDSLKHLGQAHRIDAISITTHGATAALVDGQGGLALPVLDYEHDGLDETRQAYRQKRPDFAETGSPELPLGLNIGPQLFWQQARFPEQFARAAAILMYPQYWALRLTGVLASEATSLGCHTDLWNPVAGDYSTLVDDMGWRHLFAPLRKAGDVLGAVLPEVAEAAGLAPGTPVLCGIHDSNASLVPHLLNHKPPFSVVSTGTWVVSMAVGGRTVVLDPARDTLINVNAFGQPTPSARFMGGREYELLGGGAMPAPTQAEIDAVIAQQLVLLPSVQPGCGPFPASRMRWSGEASSDGARAAAVSFYLALMTATSLELIGAAGETIVEGPFAANAEYLAMLAAATGRDVQVGAGQSTGASVGAALLAGKAPQGEAASRWISPDAKLAVYARRWREMVTAAHA